jgi:hypothetical protein
MKDSTNLSIRSFYELTSPFGFLELEITASAGADVYIDGWLGAAIRNNLLYAAENVCVAEDISLRQLIDTLALNESHPLYNNMKGGFPKGYAISLLSHIDNVCKRRLDKGEKIKFSVLLFGHYARHSFVFCEAIKKMCGRGLGNPLIPFALESILIKSEVSLSQFMNQKKDNAQKEITIQYVSPTNLFAQSVKHEPGVYTNRQHEFPGFYQLVRSSAYRIARLSTLYIYPQDAGYCDELEKHIEPFTQYAVSVLLSSAQLTRIEMQSSPKKDNPDRIQFAGYTGKLTFTGNFNYYLPLLLFAQNIGTGSNTTYGLGQFRIAEPEKQTKE